MLPSTRWARESKRANIGGTCSGSYAASFSTTSIGAARVVFRCNSMDECGLDELEGIPRVRDALNPVAFEQFHPPGCQVHRRRA